MKPRRTHDSTNALTLPGGTEDNDLWVETAVTQDSHLPIIASVWELTPQDREDIANGANLELIVFGDRHPPVDMRTTYVALGKAPAALPLDQPPVAEAEDTGDTGDTGDNDSPASPN